MKLTAMIQSPIAPESPFHEVTVEADSYEMAYQQVLASLSAEDRLFSVRRP